MVSCDSNTYEVREMDSSNYSIPRWQECTPLTGITSWLPKHFQHRVQISDLVLTCISSFEDHLVLGTNVGLVYLAHLPSLQLVKLKCENELNRITCVSAIRSVDDLIATGCVDGCVTLFLMPRILVPQNSALAAPRAGLGHNLKRFAIKSLHSSAITSLAWSCNGLRLVSGDASGAVGLLEVDYDSCQCVARHLFRETESVVQLSYWKQAVAVSTTERCLVYCLQTSTVNIVGSKPRKAKGRYGVTWDRSATTLTAPVIISATAAANSDGATVPAASTAPQPLSQTTLTDNRTSGSTVPRTGSSLLYTARPGQRVWRADSTGMVHNTMLIKDVPQDRRIRVGDENSPENIDDNFMASLRFEMINVLDTGQLVMHSSDSLVIFNPSTLILEGFLYKENFIRDVSITGECIFILSKESELFYLSSKPTNIGKSAININNVSVQHNAMVSPATLKKFGNKLFQQGSSLFGNVTKLGEAIASKVSETIVTGEAENLQENYSRNLQAELNTVTKQQIVAGETLLPTRRRSQELLRPAAEDLQQQHVMAQSLYDFLPPVGTHRVPESLRPQSVGLIHDASGSTVEESPPLVIRGKVRTKQKRKTDGSASSSPCPDNSGAAKSPTVQPRDKSASSSTLVTAVTAASHSQATGEISCSIPVRDAATTAEEKNLRCKDMMSTELGSQSNDPPVAGEAAEKNNKNNVRDGTGLSDSTVSQPEENCPSLKVGSSGELEAKIKSLQNVVEKERMLGALLDIECLKNSGIGDHVSLQGNDENNGNKNLDGTLERFIACDDTSNNSNNGRCSNSVVKNSSEDIPNAQLSSVIVDSSENTDYYLWSTSRLQNHNSSLESILSDQAGSLCYGPPSGSSVPSLYSTNSAAFLPGAGGGADSYCGYEDNVLPESEAERSSSRAPLSLPQGGTVTLAMERVADTLTRVTDPDTDSNRYTVAEESAGDEASRQVVDGEWLEMDLPARLQSLCASDSQLIFLDTENNLFLGEFDDSEKRCTWWKTSLPIVATAVAASASGCVLWILSNGQVYECFRAHVGRSKPLSDAGSSNAPLRRHNLLCKTNDVNSGSVRKEDLRGGKFELSGEQAELPNEKDDLQSKKIDLPTEMAELSSEMIELPSEKAEISSDNAELSGEKDELSSETSDLKAHPTNEQSDSSSKDKNSSGRQEVSVCNQDEQSRKTFLLNTHPVASNILQVCGSDSLLFYIKDDHKVYCQQRDPIVRGREVREDRLPSDDHCFVSLSYRAGLLWAVDSRGRVLFRIGQTASTPAGHTWRVMQEQHSAMHCNTGITAAPGLSSNSCADERDHSSNISGFVDIFGSPSLPGAGCTTSLPGDGCTTSVPGAGCTTSLPGAGCTTSESGAGCTTTKSSGRLDTAAGADACCAAVCVGSGGVGWRLTAAGSVQFRPGVSPDIPQGANTHWWQVVSSSTASSSCPQQPTLASTSQHLWLAETGAATIAQHPVACTGSWWGPTCQGEQQWSQVSAEALYGGHGALACVTPTGQLMMVNPSSGAASPVPLPDASPVVCLCQRPEVLWLLTAAGDVWLRAGLTATDAVGSHWQQLDLHQISDVHLRHLSLGTEVSWAVDTRGGVYMRQGSLAPPHPTACPQAWLQVDRTCLQGGGTFTKVFVGPDRQLVWAVDSSQRVYVRVAIFSDLPIGVAWEPVLGIRALHLSISECGGVYGVTVSGAVYRREGVRPPHNYVGTHWTKLPATLAQLSVSVDDHLWGLNQSCQLVQHRSLHSQRWREGSLLNVGGEGEEGSSPPLSLEDQEDSQEDSWEVV